MSGWVAGAIVVGALVSTGGGYLANSGNRKRKKSEEKKFDAYRDTYESLSDQAARQAEQSRVTIGQQLQQNRRLKLQEQARINQQVLMEESRLSQADRAVQIANLEGARQFEIDKMTTLMGVAGQKIAGINQNIAQTQQTWNQVGSTVSQAGATWGGPGKTTNTTGDGTQQQFQGEFEQAQYTYDPNWTP